MKKAIILIDGENFRYKTKEVLIAESITPESLEYSSIQLRSLLEKVFDAHKDLSLLEIRYYSARLQVYQENREASYKRIGQQRKLISSLSSQNVQTILAGHVRRREIQTQDSVDYVFNEKGVDVQIAVDMVTLSCDSKVDIIILCSSDSDLQPALKEAKSRGVKVIYLGFGVNPNKGLQTTADETVLFRNQEIVDSLKKK
jgi:uncharacterized LabA/DUF88 family protein